MMKKSLKRKFILPMIPVLLLLVISMTIVSSLKFSSFNNEIVLNKLETFAVSLKDTFALTKNNSLTAAVMMAENEAVKKAVKAGDTESLVRLLSPNTELFKISYFTVCDQYGQVLARTHNPSKFGDSIVNQQNVKDALNGKVSTYFEEGTEVKISLRTGAPVYDDGGTLIGVISAGIRMDTSDFVDNLKEIYSVEATVFLGDTRYATTIVHNGDRVIGTKLSRDIAEIVLNGKREYYGDAEILGMKYKAFYMPLINANNEAFAIIFMGTLTENVMAQTHVFIRDNILIGSVMLLIAILVLIFTAEAVSKPITALTGFLKEIAKGNLETRFVSIKSQDEVGQLTTSLQNTISIFRKLLDDTNTMAGERAKGDVDYFIYTQDYCGDYKKFADNINQLLEVSNQDTMSLLNVLTEFGNGNFDADMSKLPGKKIIMNQTIDIIREKMKNIINEISELVTQVINGNLSARADDSRYQGAWKEIINGLNKLIDVIIEPISEASLVLNEIAKGNLSVRITNDYKGDHAVIKNSLNTTVQTISSYIDEISVILGKLANNDLDQNITKEYVGDFKKIKDSLNNIINKLNNIIGDIHLSSEELAAGSLQISNSGTALAEGTVEQAASIEELRRVMSLLDEKVQMNTANAKTAVSLSARASEEASVSDGEMKEMLRAMENIRESSNKILKVIKIIDEIAFQTNMLAVNAAVEAARAGSYGKGFAVVAEEVGRLAQGCKNAANETTGLIENSLQTVDAGIEIVTETVNNFEKIASKTEQVSLIISKISGDTQEQALSISNVHQSVDQIGEVIQNNSAISEESAAAAQELSSRSESFKKMMSVFKMKDKP